MLIKICNKEKMSIGGGGPIKARFLRNWATVAAAASAPSSSTLKRKIVFEFVKKWFQTVRFQTVR